MIWWCWRCEEREREGGREGGAGVSLKEGKGEVVCEKEVKRVHNNASKNDKEKKMMERAADARGGKTKRCDKQRYISRCESEGWT